MPTILQSEKPFLGICLGAQILANSLGAKVDLHPDGFVEAGYYRIEPTAEGDDYFDGPAMFYQWHKEGIDVPTGATLLAQSAIFQNQVFRYGENAYGLQFHPEVLEPVVQLWFTDSPDRLKMPGARPVETHLAEFKKFDKEVDRWIRRFIERLVSHRGIPCKLRRPNKSAERKSTVQQIAVSLFIDFKRRACRSYMPSVTICAGDFSIPNFPGGRLTDQSRPASIRCRSSSYFLSDDARAVPGVWF